MIILSSKTQSRSFKEMDDQLLGRSAFIKRGKLVGQTVIIKEDLGDEKFVVQHNEKKYICHRNLLLMNKKPWR